MNIINEKVTQYMDSLYTPLNEYLADLRTHAEEKHVPIILRDTETLILNLIRIKNPQRILEIGTAVGYSASCFATASLNVKVTSLELNEDMYKLATLNIEAAGLTDRIQIILGDAKESIRALRETMNDIREDGYDLVFIDAAKTHYKDFWDECMNICKPDAVIISDNVLLKARTVSDEYITEKRQKTSVKRMREFLYYITNLDNIETSVLSVGDGVAVSVIRGWK